MALRLVKFDFVSASGLYILQTLRLDCRGLSQYISLCAVHRVAMIPEVFNVWQSVFVGCSIEATQIESLRSVELDLTQYSTV